MRARLLSLPMLGAALLTLAACATTSVSSAPPASEIEPTVPLSPETTTTVEPTTTEAPTTTAAPTTEAPTTTAAPTTTVPPAPPPPPAPVMVNATEAPIQAVGSSSGAEAMRAQWRLVELGFWVDQADGSFGHTTRQAVMAFQKYRGIEADGVIGDTTAALLSEAQEKPRGRTDAGTVVEVDKSRQLIFFVIDGQTHWILNTSTGTEIPYEEPNKNDPLKIERGDSITPAGLHKVNRERAEGWWEGDLGEIYRPKYFVGGVAVHGSNSIPNHPASHGCVRVSVQAMDFIWATNLMPMGIPVWVHGSIPV